MDCVERPVELRTKAAMNADIRTHRQTALVVNVRSRRGRRHYETVRRKLRAAGLDLIDAQPVAQPAQLPDTLARAVNGGWIGDPRHSRARRPGGDATARGSTRQSKTDPPAAMPPDSTTRHSGRISSPS